MVQVIQPPKQRQATCLQCRAVLGFTQGEVKSIVYKDIAGDSELKYCIVCPCCNANVYVGRHE